MNRTSFAIVSIVLAALPVSAPGYPEGAPWGAADPDASENCSACHFDDEPILNSASIAIDGLPAEPVTDETYEFVVRFEDADAVAAGFQLLARATAGSAGLFSANGSMLEAGAAGIRSTRPTKNENGVQWTIKWTAPDNPGATIQFFLAVTGANDDGSPLGDQVHFRSFGITL